MNSIHRSIEERNARHIYKDDDDEVDDEFDVVAR